MYIGYFDSTNAIGMELDSACSGSFRYRKHTHTHTPNYTAMHPIVHAAMMPMRRMLEAARRAGGGGSVHAVRKALEDMGLIVPAGGSPVNLTSHKGSGPTSSASESLKSGQPINSPTFQLAVERSHFEAALTASKPSVGHSEGKRYEAWMREFGSV